MSTHYVRLTPKGTTALDTVELPMTWRQARIMAVLTTGPTTLPQLHRNVNSFTGVSISDKAIAADLAALQSEGYVVVYQ